MGYDAKRAFRNSTGLGNYSRLVIGTMAGMYPDNRYVLATPSDADRTGGRMDMILMRENVSVLTPPGVWGHIPSLWRSAAMGPELLEAGVDLYHGLSNEIPLGPMPCATVVTIHDLIWRRVPGDYSAIDRRLYDLKYGRSARRATRIIAISERTRDDLVADWNIDPARIDVIYQGIDPAFSRPVDFDSRRNVAERYGLTGRYIITVGTVQSRKNQLLTVKAMQSLPADVQLAIVGRGTGEYAAKVDRAIAESGLSNRVRRLEDVPFDDLPALYAGAVASAYTSRYEGFGLPVVESIAAGTPVVACKGSCLEEAGGPGAIYVDADDVGACAEALNAILAKQYVRDRMVENGRRYIRRFNASDFAESIMKTYSKALLDHELASLKQ